MTLRVPVLARFPWPGGAPFQAGGHPHDDPGCLLSRPGRSASLAVESAPAFGYDSTAPGGVPQGLRGRTVNPLAQPT